MDEHIWNLLDHMNLDDNNIKMSQETNNKLK
jgi:hypothetical protein